MKDFEGKVAFLTGAGAGIGRISAKMLAHEGARIVIAELKPELGEPGAEAIKKAGGDAIFIETDVTDDASVGKAAAGSRVALWPHRYSRELRRRFRGTTQFYVLVVHPGIPASSVKELIAAAKAAQGRFNFGSSQWSVGHLAGEMFKLRTGVEMTQIAYKGTGPAISALLGGQLTLMFSTAPPAVPLVKAGRLRALAITAAKRSPLMPELPTVAESGVPGFEATGWNGFLVAAKTPKAIVTKLHREIVRTLALPDVKERYAGAGIEPAGSSPEEFGLLIRQEIAKWGRVIKEANLKADE